MTEIQEKHIRRKIQSKESQIELMGQTGPMALLIVGIIVLIFFWWPVGLGAIIIAAVWSQMRDNETRKLKDEIEELEVLLPEE